MPVQDAGRLKPFDTFCRETLQLFYGRQEYQGRSAVEMIMTMMMVPEFWDQQPIMEINHSGLKEALALEMKRKHFTPVEILASDRLTLIMQSLQKFRESKDKLTPYFQAVQRLEGQIGMYQALKQLQGLHLVPPGPEEAAQPQDPQATAEAPRFLREGQRLQPRDQWVTVANLDPEMAGLFQAVFKAFVRDVAAADGPGLAGLTSSQGADSDAVTPSLVEAVGRFVEAARARNPAVYATDRDMKIEAHYKALHPFMWSWILYALAAVAMGVAWAGKWPSAYGWAWGLSILGFLLHTYGFALRTYITGRPPVSNMYETVIWVSWGTILFAWFFEWKHKRRFILFAGLLVGVLCNIVADLAPTVLDKSLQPLEPVLRSNLWLVVHVLTITISYSAFFLAWALGNIGLGYFLRGEPGNGERARAISDSIYRSLQVGVVLLAAGTILGGVWADYSWGRFWGWDPKETWALIALLGYLAILHGRLVGWVQNFGMMMWSVLAFNLVIMAWYGVNFVLGAGLHSYGFGAGGVQYVGAFTFINILYVGYVAYVKRAYALLRVKSD
jgi:ABC-type transport system involved in cytochrome c biogenesis permease subunit